jgi:hypothetical protein
MWSDMLSHQLPVLPPLHDFWDALPEIFNWIASGAEIPQRALIQHSAGEIAVRARVLPMGVPIRSRSTLEIIRFAAATSLCVDLTSDGGVRGIEPYPLRQPAEGNFVLHAIRSDSGEHRSYRVDRMQNAAVTSQVFTPRYPSCQLNSYLGTFNTTSLRPSGYWSVNVMSLPRACICPARRSLRALKPR